MVATTQLPAEVRITDLPAGTAPTGAEQIEAVQSGNSVNLTLAQIVNAAIATSSALSVLGVAGATSGPVAPITGTTDQVLRITTTLGFGAINLATSAAVTGTLSTTNLPIIPLGIGGFGTTTLTAHGVVLGNGTSIPTITSTQTAGQLLIGQNATSDPLWRAITGDITVSALGTVSVVSVTLGTGSVAYSALQSTAGPLVLGNSTSAVAAIAAITGTTDQALRIGTTGILAFGPINLSTTAAVTGSLAATLGGTGNTTFVAGDLLYASNATTLARLADIATTNVLLSGGVGVLPAWGKVNLSAATSFVTGTLPVSNGGIGIASGTSGGIIGFTNATTLASSVVLTLHAIVIGGGAGATPTPLASLGNATSLLHGAAAGDPTFGQLVYADVASAALATTGDFVGNTASKILQSLAVWNDAPPLVVSDNTTYTPNFSNNINFELQLGTSCSTTGTIANPAGTVKPGQTGAFTLIQDGTGSRKINTWGSQYKFSGGTKPTLSTASTSVDVFSYWCRNATSILCFFASGEA